MKNGIIIRKYEKKDLPSMITIWNEVVREGNAFPQEECLDPASGADFFGEQSFCGVAENEAGEILGLYILRSTRWWPPTSTPDICTSGSDFATEASRISARTISKSAKPQPGRTAAANQPFFPCLRYSPGVRPVCSLKRRVKLEIL